MCEGICPEKVKHQKYVRARVTPRAYEKEYVYLQQKLKHLEPVHPHRRICMSSPWRRRIWTDSDSALSVDKHVGFHEIMRWIIIFAASQPSCQLTNTNKNQLQEAL
jgi:hypothetical protein